MPADSLVWIVAIAAAALVLSLAIWKGRGLRLRHRNTDLSLRPGESPPNPPTRQGKARISVGERIVLDDVRAGDIAGIKSQGPLISGPDEIDVARGARLHRADVGDIVGIRQGEGRED